MRSLLQDLRYALRQLRKSPGFTFTAVSVLALGLGANIAVFTVLNGVLLRPLPYAQPDRVVLVNPAGVNQYYPMSYSNMLQLRDAVGAKMQIGATMGASMASIVGPGGRFQVEHQIVTAGLFNMLGVQPAMGRGFRDEENDPGRSRVVLVSEPVWRNQYASDPNIVGMTLTIKSQAYTILGVMPKGFSFPFGEGVQVWTPAELPAASRSAMDDEHARQIDNFYARLPEGMTAAQLTDLLSRTQAVIAKEVPNTDLPTRVTVTSYQQSLNERLRKPLLLLYAVVFGIWALACLNVTSLMLARAVARTRELAVRAALGASRARLLRQTVVESLLLSAIGSIFGLLLGQSAIKLLWHQIDRNLRMLSSAVHLDWRVTVSLAALTLITAILVGVFPALRAMRRDVQGSLHGVTATASASQNRTREALVVAQLALTLVFLVGAGLFLRTIHALRAVPLGFTQQNVLTGGIILNAGSHQLEDEQGSPGQQENVVRDKYLPLIERLRAIPGVQVVALSSVLPLRSEMRVMICSGLDHVDQKEKRACAQGRLASAGLADALGIPILRGRFFTEEDAEGAPITVVVNEAFAKQFSPEKDPIGRIYSMGKEGPFANARIIGVIGDTRQSTVVDPTKPEVYFSLAQTSPGTPLYGIAAAFIQVAIRGAIPADSLRAQFDKALHEVAPYATTTDVKTIHEAVEDSFGSQTLIAHLLESFAILALLISSVGLYGLLSFAVAQRTREIGLRIALGAPQGSILSLILRRALLLDGIGLTLGGALAWFAVRFAGSYIYGVQAHDALTFAAVVVMLASASLVAAWLPARRAAAVDPVLALRSE
jgi:predicted permease